MKNNPFLKVVKLDRKALKILEEAERESSAIKREAEEKRKELFKRVEKEVETEVRAYKEELEKNLEELKRIIRKELAAKREKAEGLEVEKISIVCLNRIKEKICF